MSVDTGREQTGLGVVAETEQLIEPLTKALEDFLLAREELEGTIIRAVLAIDSDIPPDNLEEIRQRVIDAYNALSNHNYYPYQVIARPSLKITDEVL